MSATRFGIYHVRRPLRSMSGPIAVAGGTASISPPFLPEVAAVAWWPEAIVWAASSRRATPSPGFDPGSNLLTGLRSNNYR